MIAPLKQTDDLVLVIAVRDFRLELCDSMQIDDEIGIRLRKPKHPPFVVRKWLTLCTGLAHNSIHKEALRFSL